MTTMEARLAPLTTLAIEHVDGSDPASFKLTRLADGKSLAQVSVPSPYEFPVPGHPGSLMRGLRWYLEGFLDYPFPPETSHAEHVIDALKGWGTQAFNALFDRRDAGAWLNGSDSLQVRSDDAAVLSWPWEALYDPQAGSYAALQHRIERRLNRLPDPPPLASLPADRVNILLVVARPYDNDVGYRSIARPLIELIESQNLPAHVDVLRPPTFDNLRDHLRKHPGHYHVLHFDGHGAFGNGSGGSSPHRFRSPEGCLVFENQLGQQDPKSAADLSALLREHAIPAVVLNACQSATLNQHAENPFATVATALLQSGMRSVVAMAYSLYVSGAQAFLPAFYRRLFETGQVAEATRAGRQQMLSQRNRMSPRGPFPLDDWLLPVLYQQAPLEFAFAAKAKRSERISRLPQEVTQHRDPYGFIGRDGPILEMERALHRKAPCILVQGLGGVGKTTLARGFLRWLDETGGLDAALWFDFRDIRTAEYVMNQTGGLFYGENFGVAPSKFELLTRACGEHRLLMVWDNFESAEQNLSSEDRSELGRLLDAIHGTRSKVIMTSRSPEEWLGPARRFALPLGGLDGEERWEYCDVILQELGLATKVNRNDPDLTKLMDQLSGHPLAMRAVLPKLERMPAARIAEALRTNLAELGLDEREEQGKLFATLGFVEQGLPEELKPLLGLVGLHESYLDANYLEAMAKQVDPARTRNRIDRLMAAMTGAGLMREIGQATYEMHPFLTSYLRWRHAATPEPAERAFVDVMARLADELAPRELHEQRVPFLLHGANFRFARTLAGKHSLDNYFAALTQSLALHAQNTRNFVEASRLFGELAQHATSRADADAEASSYHQLGVIADEQRDFATAREWYLKSLAISEKQGNLHGAASTYHQLGRIAEEQRDFATAREWYLKSLAIKEKQGNLHGAAITYHQLGSIAQLQRDFATAREWYLKSLAIDEKQGNLHGAAITYHQLGSIAEEQRDFATAREWYLKSLAIKEKQGNLHGAASTYHQLGRIAEEQRDFATAREWYLKSLAISEKQGNLHGAAITYHQLGSIAQLQRDFATAREWYLKSLAISEKQGNLHGAAITYHQLGIIAQEQRDFATAREWHLKSLAISEKQGNLHGAASTYGQLGNLAVMQGEMESGGRWFIRAIQAFLQASDQHYAELATRNFFRLYRQAPQEDKAKLEAMWKEADLGSFPTDTN